MSPRPSAPSNHVQHHLREAHEEPWAWHMPFEKKEVTSKLWKAPHLLLWDQPHFNPLTPEAFSSVGHGEAETWK